MSLLVLIISCINCHISIHIQIFGCIRSKYTIYVMLLERLWLIFSDSKLEFSKSSIICTRVTLITLFSIAIILIFRTKTSETLHRTGFCAPNVRLIAKAFFVFTDMVITTLVLVLFSRKLWLLSMHTIPNQDCRTSQRNKYIGTMNRDLLARL